MSSTWYTSASPVMSANINGRAEGSADLIPDTGFCLSDYFLSGPPLWLNGSEHFPGHTDKRVQREKAVTHHPPRVIYRNGNDQHVRNLFQNGSNATDVEWLDSPRPGPCAFRENKRRPILRSHISGQFKNFSDGLLRILAVYVGCSSVAKIERDAGNTTRQFDLGNKLSVMLTEE